MDQSCKQYSPYNYFNRKTALRSERFYCNANDCEHYLICDRSVSTMPINEWETAKPVRLTGICTRYAYAVGKERMERGGR